MAAVTLATLRSRVRSKADMLDDTFCSDSELNDFINEACGSLYDLLTTKFERYNFTEAAATLSGSTHTLPENFYKLHGVDVLEDGKWRPLKEYDWSRRNEYRNNTGGRAPEVRYELRDKRTLHFLPAWPASTSALIHYTPQVPLLVADSDSVDFLQGWEKLVVLEAAIEALGKAERSTARLEAAAAKVRGEIDRAAEQRKPSEPVRATRARDEYERYEERED